MAYAKIKSSGITIDSSGITIPGLATFVVDDKTAGIMGASEEAIKEKLENGDIVIQDIMPTDAREVAAGSIALYPPAGKVWMMGPSEKWLVYKGVSNITG